MENRITSRIKTGYYLEFLLPETMKLVGSTKGKIGKDKNGENLPQLEINEVGIRPFWYCQQWLSPRFKGLVYICS